MQITYTATRNIINSHTLNLTYIIDVDVQRNDLAPFWNGATLKALAGNEVNVTHSDGLDYNIKTVSISTATTPAIEDMREFLNSVRRGEAFSIDGVPCKLKDLRRSYTEKYESNLYKTYSFNVKVL